MANLLEYPSVVGRVMGVDPWPGPTKKGRLCFPVRHSTFKGCGCQYKVVLESLYQGLFSMYIGTTVIDYCAP
jgi:hypothetical protein